MRLKNFTKKINLTEMFVKADTPNGYSYEVYYTMIAYQSTVWLIADNEVSDNMLNDIISTTNLDVERFSTFNSDLNEVHNLVEALEERPDILTGAVSKGVMYLDSRTHMNPRSSLLIKKIAEQLQVRVSVNHLDFEGNDYEEKFHLDDYEGKIPDIVYHGTNLKAILSILKTGLRDEGTSNWGRVGKFSGKVFLTASLPYAIYHASLQARDKKSIPVIIATKLPDPSKIDWDFDMAAAFKDGTSIDDEYMVSITRNNMSYNTGDAVAQAGNETDCTRETGIFSYNGRIPPSFFQALYVPGEPGTPVKPENLTRIDNPKEMWDAYDILADFGYYVPEMLDELDEDEDEDEDDF